MSTSRVTSKGQVTIPAGVRKALDIAQGDDLIFEVSSDRTARLRVVKRHRLSDLFASLPAKRSFPGKAAVRKQVGRALGARSKGSAS